MADSRGRNDAPLTPFYGADGAAGPSASPAPTSLPLRTNSAGNLGGPSAPSGPSGSGTRQGSNPAAPSGPPLPPRPSNLAETDLDPTYLEEHVLKVIVSIGTVTGNDLAERLRLPLAGIVDPLIAELRRDNLIEPVQGGQAMIGSAGMILRPTERGTRHAQQLVERGGYAGPAPVSLASFVRGLRDQVAQRRFAGREYVWRRLAHLVLPDEVVDRVGLGVESGGPLFVYGNAGNGKTAIAASVARVLGGEMLVPYAVEVDGQIIRVFDSSAHRPLPAEATQNLRFDERWVPCQVPFVQAGGELRLDQLDLRWNERQRYYDCPIQVKAAGGVLFVDDFGRQAYPPEHLLNRWIVPLETGTDYLTLATGRQVPVPFTSLLVFATNMVPSELGDDAFLRRLPCKVEVPDPSADAYREIFRRTSTEMGIEFNESAFNYLRERYYTKPGRLFRASQPRDLLRLVASSARYFNVPPQLTPQLVDVAAGLYFV
ncbi:MAG TPA: hypothetical protein VIG30_10310 [Ktedonobacterales bacterium]